MAFLPDHDYGHRASWSSLAVSLVTGGSGIPYAVRHLELSNVEPDQKVAHRFIAFVEFTPIIGGIVAIVERVAYALFGSDSLEKMMKNQEKALIEHRKDCGEGVYVREISLLASDLQKEESGDLELSYHFTAAQGARDRMEDTHFYKEIENGILTGVFDGHAGDEVSKYASDQFQQKFPKVLSQTRGDVHRAFRGVICQIHQEVANRSDWNKIGSTAVVSYIDKKTHQIFTATLGDSEANIYRKGESGKLVSIPLSCVRNWLSKRDRNRLCRFYGEKAVARRIVVIMRETGIDSSSISLSQLLACRNVAKGIRSSLDSGMNVSRAIGDVASAGSLIKPLIIHKPKITVNKVKPGDTVILACDGLKDFLTEKEIVSTVERRSVGTPQRAELLANELVVCALEKMDPGEGYGDNVTVGVVDIKLELLAKSSKISPQSDAEN